MPQESLTLWLLKTSVIQSITQTRALCTDPSQPNSIYIKLLEKSTIARTLWERVPCLFQYALQRSLGGVHGTCISSIA